MVFQASLGVHDFDLTGESGHSYRNDFTGLVMAALMD